MSNALGNSTRWLAALAGGGRRAAIAGMDLVFPPACAVCQSPLEATPDGPLVCELCQQKLIDNRPTCGRCGELSPEIASGRDSCPQCAGKRLHFSTVLRLGEYEGPLRAAVLRTKQSREQPMAKALGDLLAATRREMLRALDLHVVVPIPMFWLRKMWRGCNSPEIVARRVAGQLRIPAADFLLKRTRNTEQQSHLAPNRRFKNVRGAFQVKKHRDLAGARVLLVDDILTTGATCSAAARALLEAGASYVAVAVIARAENLEHTPPAK